MLTTQLVVVHRNGFGAVVEAVVVHMQHWHAVDERQSPLACEQGACLYCSSYCAVSTTKTYGLCISDATDITCT